MLHSVSKMQNSTTANCIYKIALCEKRFVVLNGNCLDNPVGLECIEKDPDLFDQITMMSEGLVRGEKQFSFEYYSKENNEWYNIHIQYADELYEEEHLVYFMYITDITKLKKELLEARRLNIEYETLTRSLSSGILKVKNTTEYPIIWANQSMSKMLGYEEGEFLEKYRESCIPLIISEEQHRFLELVEQVKIMRTAKSRKFRMRTKNGTLRWFSVRFEYAKYGGINPEQGGFYCVINDITEEVHKEQELKNFQERYKTVLSVTSEFVFEYTFATNTMIYFGGDKSSLHRPMKVENFFDTVLEAGIGGGRLTEDSREEVEHFFHQFEVEKVELSDAYLCYEFDDGRNQWVYVVGKALYNSENEPEVIIGKLSDVTLHKEEEKKLLYKARNDGLTTVNNREYTAEQIRAYLSTCSKSVLPTLIILDIDNFKSINDQYGHGEGDKVLVELSNILKDEFRASDIIGRLGGDEFVVFMKDVISVDVVYEKAENLCKRVKEHLGKVSVSIGVSIINDGKATFERLYRTADVALYQAKVRGKNTFVSYSDLPEELKEMAIPANPTNGAKVEVVSLDRLEEDLYNLQTAKLVLNTYDFYYSVNLTKDLVIRMGQNIDHSTEPLMVSYTQLYHHIQDEVFDKDEKLEFVKYFKRENLLKAIENGDTYFHRYFRVFNTKQEFHWYLVEVVVEKQLGNGDRKCVMLFKDVQKSRNEEMRKFESRTKNAYIQILEEQKAYDSLTGIYKPNKFYEEAKKKIWEDVSKNYAMVSFDVDRFRVINDIYSEEVGNQIICNMADVLRNIELENKVYGRYYADCFTIMFQYENKQDIVDLIHQICEECHKCSLVTTPFKLSFGVYLINDRNLPIRLMCDWARLAKQRVKGLTMQYYAFYNEEYRTEQVETQKIEEDMHKALENHDFKMYLQPKYDLRTNQVLGAEALVRWKHHEKGMMYPNKFIPLFEKNGFILRLDEYIWEQACKQIRIWLDQGVSMPISVNISRLHTYDTMLVQKLLTLVQRYNIPVEMLELEFTEGLFMENVQALYSLMHELKKHGFVLQMDDFGSGYSSLNMLKSVPIDVIKLDKAFFEDMLVNERGKIIIENSIKMIHDLNLQVMAEGIETKEHVDFLNQSNCATGQGYFYAKPMPIEEFHALYISK